MKGYKIFIKKDNMWRSPHYLIEKDWVIEEGSILQAYEFDPRVEVGCGAGVNFWVTKKAALSAAERWKRSGYEVKMFRVETLSEEEGEVVRPVDMGYTNKHDLLTKGPKHCVRHDKARAQTLQLLKCVKHWKRRNR